MVIVAGGALVFMLVLIFLAILFPAFMRGLVITVVVLVVVCGAIGYMGAKKSEANPTVSSDSE